MAWLYIFQTKHNDEGAVCLCEHVGCEKLLFLSAVAVKIFSKKKPFVTLLYPHSFGRIL